MSRAEQRAWAKLVKVGNWKRVFASWQLGTTSESYGPYKAVADHRELSINLKIVTDALADILVSKGVCTLEEWHDAVFKQAELYDKDLEARFPGFKTTNLGLQVSPEAARTARRFNFPP